MSKSVATIFLLLFSLSSWGIDPQELRCVIDATAHLAESTNIQRALEDYNRRVSDPMPLELRWSELSDDSPEVLQITHNPAAAEIHTLIHRYAYQGEGFLIGLNGGLVAATNRTSDYFQADEAQFNNAIRLAKGQSWIETNIVDTSASALLIKIAVPVFTTEANNAATEPPPASGVLVIGLDQFVVDFYRGCHILDPRH